MENTHINKGSLDVCRALKKEFYIKSYKLYRFLLVKILYFAYIFNN